MQRIVAILLSPLKIVSDWLKSDHAPATVAAIVALFAYFANDAQERRALTHDLVRLSYSSDFISSYSQIDRLGNRAAADFAGGESLREALRKRHFAAYLPEFLAKSLDQATVNGALVWLDYLRVLSECVKIGKCDKDIAGLLLAERASMIYHNLEPFILAVRRDLPWPDFGKGACEIRNLDARRNSVNCDQGSPGVNALAVLPESFMPRQ